MPHAWGHSLQRINAISCTAPKSAPIEGAIAMDAPGLIRTVGQ